MLAMGEEDGSQKKLARRRAWAKQLKTPTELQNLSVQGHSN